MQNTPKGTPKLLYTRSLTSLQQYKTPKIQKDSKKTRHNSLRKSQRINYRMILSKMLRITNYKNFITFASFFINESILLCKQQPNRYNMTQELAAYLISDGVFVRRLAQLSQNGLTVVDHFRPHVKVNKNVLKEYQDQIKNVLKMGIHELQEQNQCSHQLEYGHHSQQPQNQQQNINQNMGASMVNKQKSNSKVNLNINKSIKTKGNHEQINKIAYHQDTHRQQEKQTQTQQERENRLLGYTSASKNNNKQSRQNRNYNSKSKNKNSQNNKQADGDEDPHYNIIIFSEYIKSNKKSMQSYEKIKRKYQEQKQNQRAILQSNNARQAEKLKRSSIDEHRHEHDADAHTHKSVLTRYLSKQIMKQLHEAQVHILKKYPSIKYIINRPTDGHTVITKAKQQIDRIDNYSVYKMQVQFYCRLGQLFGFTVGDGVVTTAVLTICKQEQLERSGQQSSEVDYGSQSPEQVRFYLRSNNI